MFGVNRASVSMNVFGVCSRLIQLGQQAVLFLMLWKSDYQNGSTSSHFYHLWIHFSYTSSKAFIVTAFPGNSYSDWVVMESQSSFNTYFPDS